MTRGIRVAAGQLSSGPDPAANLALAGDVVRDAAARGAQVIVLPEATMASFGSPLRSLAQPVDGPFGDGIRAVAAEVGAWVVAGMFTPADDGRVRNTLIATDGERLVRYDKIHLFDAFSARESDSVQPGTELVTFEALGTTIGLATCYDVRFAAQFTALGLAGAELICLPASWGDGPRKAEMFDLLVRSRAMDAQAWLVGADQAFVPDQGSTPLGVGHSAIVGPLGEVIASAGGERTVVVADVDLDVVATVRANVPVLSSQRQD